MDFSPLLNHVVQFNPFSIAILGWLWRLEQFVQKLMTANEVKMQILRELKEALDEVKENTKPYDIIKINKAAFPSKKGGNAD